LKRAQLLLDPPRTEPVAEQPERRRSARWSAHVPVFVYGHVTERQPFHEEAYSTNVSAVGARLIMMATVRPGQTLLLINKVSQAEQECRVAYVGGRDPQTVEVAVEFSQPAEDFWRLTSKPEPAQSPENSSDSG
jgi:hypothetical protein